MNRNQTEIFKAAQKELSESALAFFDFACTDFSTQDLALAIIREVAAFHTEAEQWEIDISEARRACVLALAFNSCE